MKYTKSKTPIYNAYTSDPGWDGGKLNSFLLLLEASQLISLRTAEYKAWFGQPKRELIPADHLLMGLLLKDLAAELSLSP